MTDQKTVCNVCKKEIKKKEKKETKFKCIECKCDILLSNKAKHLNSKGHLEKLTEEQKKEMKESKEQNKKLKQSTKVQKICNDIENLEMMDHLNTIEANVEMRKGNILQNVKQEEKKKK